MNNTNRKCIFGNIFSSFFLWIIFSRIQVTNRGLAEKFSQSHGNSRNLQHITLIEKQKN